ncbi:hypothetical protein [Flavobacterium sp. NKUCC04_CG]|uniref:hypothetical protein n=1 Tax=Flavobacterium sp. NKUCC04_CG TaxID=2842121 RepID=UPI001C5BC1F5|nr:hypothetical protein [Flavobacterium sp. NKUCC04_CG]MBW3517745.1 hypothetical protein [Flavobacterium sp. NKUCC04_CG]
MKITTVEERNPLVQAHQNKNSANRKLSFVYESSKIHIKGNLCGRTKVIIVIDTIRNKVGKDVKQHV